MRETKPIWDAMHPSRRSPERMGLAQTYVKAAEWLDCRGLLLEDWGGGTGYMRRYVEKGEYRLVDGSWSEWADTVAELTEYRSAADCILLRHVLEHNHEWAAILDNAVASFGFRLCIVLFTPLADETALFSRRRTMPSYSFALDDLVGRFPANVNWTLEQIGTESLIYAERYDPPATATEEDK